MRVALAPLVLLAVLLAACGSGGAPTTTAPQGIPRLAFAYDSSAPLALRDRGVVARVGGVTIRDVSFASRGRRIEALLVVPRNARRLPAVVFVHGTGGDRQQLIQPAVGLAQRGAVALTVSSPSAKPPARPSEQAAVIRQQRDLAVADVVAVRRAVDYLSTLPSVDPSRIGYLGWSAGGRLGAFVGAAEPRVRALALLSAGAEPIAAFVAQAPADLRPQVRRDLGSVDPLRYIGRVKAKVLLENGEDDEVVPRDALKNFVRAAPKGTRVRWYPTGHPLNVGAYTDAFVWLLDELG